MKAKKKRKSVRLSKQKLGLTVAIIILLLILLFFSRFGILRYYINRKVHHFNQNKHVELRIENISFKGINVVSLKKLLLVSKSNKDSLLYVDSTNFKINIFSIFTGSLLVNSFFANDLRLHLINKEGYNNYSFLLRNDKQITIIKQQKTDFAKQVNKLFEVFFYKIPEHIDVNKIYCLLDIDSGKLKISSDKLVLENNNIETFLNIEDRKNKSKLSIKGNIDAEKNMLSFILFSGSQKKFVLNNFKVPFADIELNTFGFDTLNLRINNNGWEHDIINLTGVLSISKFNVSNPRIAQNEVAINKAGIEFNFNIGEDFIEIDSSSVFSINSLKLSPYIKYLNGNSKKIILLLNKKKFNAQGLFESLPAGMFDNLQGIKTKGELEYHLKFIADLSLPDSLKFNSSLLKKNFSILSFGNSNLPKLNGSFAYTAYDKNKAVKTFTVGAENPEFISLKSISPLLIYSVLTSEDGGFFINNGFNEESFRESIIKNIKEKRFARGGSTITMQLVKNVFLNRNKNISRKLEEALIVWLIESNNLCSKDRMLEVYLNIIEWGPGIYGIGEASKFYFNKKAANLTLAESIYLASIIPHPKWYKYSFDENGNLKDYMKEFYKLVSSKMLRKEYITQSDFDKLKPEVKLKGSSLKMLMQDTLGKKVNIDSQFINVDDE